MFPRSRVCALAADRPRRLLAVALLVVAWIAGDCAANVAPVTNVSGLSSEGGMVVIRSWLVAGPFPSPDLPQPSFLGPKRAGFDTDFLTSIGGEAAARPRAGMAVHDPDGGQIVFAAREWYTRYIDLTDAFGRLSHACAYIYAEVESEEETSAYLRIGSNDAAKVWVGGKLVISSPLDRRARPSQNVARVDFPAGRTPILLKIDQAGGHWGAYVDVSSRPYERPHGALEDLPPAVLYVWIPLFGVLGLGWIPLLVWFQYRRSRAREARTHELRLAMIEKGIAPNLLDAQLAPLKRRRMLVWGLVLTLAGAALSISLAVSRSHDLWFGLVVMLTGTGLLIAAEYSRRTAYDAEQRSGEALSGAPDQADGP